MPAPPLTHHEILDLVEPFARRGRHVDLAASDRILRRLAFKPIDHPAASPPAPGMREGLQLESFGTGTFRLTRTLTRGDGLQATLQASGSDPGELLARIDGVDRQRHFVDGPGHAIARSYQFESFTGGTGPGTGPGLGAPPGTPSLSRGVVRVGALTLTVDVPAVRGVAADLTLTAAPGERPDLPEDLLAVIGWDWARLVPNPNGWTSKRRLRGRGAQRSLAAERVLDTAAAHLARVLQEPPARFHDRHVWARWGVVLRRLIPTLTAVGLIAGAVLLPRLAPQQDPSFWLALHYVPIGLLALSFCLQELPRFEIPPWPRRLRAQAWRPSAPAAHPMGDRCSATR